MGNKLKFLLEYNEYLKDISELNNIDDIKIYDEINKHSKFNSLVLLEGLILTHPLTKSINIINKRFPNLIVQSEQDGEIYIEGEIDLLNNLPIFTNLGYFISSYTINGNEWLKDYNKNTKPIALFLEPKYDYKIENIPDILYHVSPLKFKNKILKYGLSPRSGNKLANHPERIYLSNSIEHAFNFGAYLKKDSNEFYQDGYCIYSIDTEQFKHVNQESNLENLYSDINFREGGYYTNNNIYPTKIKLEREVIY